MTEISVNEDVRACAEARLRNLSQILSVQVAHCAESEHLAEELDRLGDHDLVLVDTRGRSPRQEQAIGQLAERLQRLGDHEVHLVLSADRSESAALASLEAFRPTGFDRLVWTKVDEVASHGLILSVAGRVAERLAYLSDGPEPLEAVKPADPEAVAAMVVGGDGSDG